MNSTKRLLSISRVAAPVALCFLACAMSAFAQNDPFLTGATTISADGILAVRALGALFLGGGGIGILMDHNHGMSGKLLALGVGAIFVFVPTQVASFAQSL